MSSIHELLKQVYPLKLRMELFNAIWTNWREDVKEKDQRMLELEEQLKNAIVPKFNRQEHICGFAFGEIREYIIFAYLDNNVTLCENIETGELELCDNNFLVRTFEEAQAKLEELSSTNGQNE